jgi:hypothetical protein
MSAVQGRWLNGMADSLTGWHLLCFFKDGIFRTSIRVSAGAVSQTPNYQNGAIYIDIKIIK